MSAKALEKPGIAFAAVAIAAVAVDRIPALGSLKPLVTAGVVLAISVVILYWRPLLDALALTTVRFLSAGFRAWAERSVDTGEDSLWTWISDQVLVMQGRYAFSVSAIVFKEDDRGELSVLVQEAEFPDSKDPVLVWPGGRFRGMSGTVEDELRKHVEELTGCRIRLDRYHATLIRSDGLSEKMHTASAREEDNEIFIPPLIIMRQNRAQTNEVPGHIDLIYLARVEDAGPLRAKAQWIQMVDLEDQKQFPQSRIWPDTVACVTRAAEVFRNLRAAKIVNARLGSD